MQKLSVIRTKAYETPGISVVADKIPSCFVPLPFFMVMQLRNRNQIKLNRKAVEKGIAFFDSAELYETFVNE